MPQSYRDAQHSSIINHTTIRRDAQFGRLFYDQYMYSPSLSWKSQIATSNKIKMGLRKTPLAFTEQGVSMLSAVLKSKVAIRTSIQIITAFVRMRKVIIENSDIKHRLSYLEEKQVSSNIRQIEADNKIDAILDAIQEQDIKPKQGIFYDEQVFDAYVFVADLIKSAKKSIVLIDNYVDESVLQLFTKRKEIVAVTIYTKNLSTILKQDLEKYNAQYPKIEMVKFTKSHDRFLIIDEITVYHFGASLKDLGKRWFAFSKMDIEAMEMITKII